jgi:threonylcarbamoyladenosine tRNA methylthiotransferase MtaB
MQKNNQEPSLLTFGCRLNTYESEVMKNHAKKAGLENAIIVNSCAVTAEAERQARQSIRKARKENPDAKIIVTGCAAQINPDMFAQMPEVDQIIGNDLKLKPESWGLSTDQKIIVNDIMSVRETANHLIEGFDGHTRAFIQVQNGCDHRCTFCIIPYGRGNSRSVPVAEIIAQINLLVEQGYHEIVLTGVDVTSYGKDLSDQPPLGRMMKQIFKSCPDLSRLRLSSLDPVEMDEDLWDLIANEPRLMPHLHMSLQAGDDMILKRMKRRHLRQDAIDMCNRARNLRPDIEFGADIIAGFPTETEDMFENTCRAVTECDLTFLHVFPYSPRPLTPAAKMPQLPNDIRKKRAAILRELGQKQLQAFQRRHLGRKAQAIIEQDGTARTETFAQVHLSNGADIKIGSLQRIQIQSIHNNQLMGALIA